MHTPKDLLNCGLGAHSNESSQPSGGGIAGGPAVQFQIQAEQPVGMRDPRPRQWGALGRCAARLRARSREECEAQTATTAQALTRRSSPTRQRGSSGAQQRPELAGPDLSSRATVLDPAPEGPGREAAARRQREARGKPASALTV